MSKIEVEDRTNFNTGWALEVASQMIRISSVGSLIMGLGIRQTCYALFLAGELVGYAGSKVGFLNDLNFIKGEAKKFAEDEVNNNSQVKSIIDAVNKANEKNGGSR